MPKSAVKQKKLPKAKANARSPFESTNIPERNAGDDDSDVEMDGASDGEEEVENVPEKDEAEKKLERILFGDDQGFQGALRDQQDRGLMALAAQSDEEDGGAEGEKEGEGDDDGKGLEDVADADVCSSYEYFYWMNADELALFPRLRCRSCFYRSSRVP